jgi:2,4-dienoyl-CoA reductase-like NADH-dependent reductase (Old Yellow Enzyme family)
MTSANRIMVSPMCMYSASGGMANDYHLVHLGRFALGGAGIVIAEATAVEERGRISSGDLGLWQDAQARALEPIAASPWAGPGWQTPTAMTSGDIAATVAAWGAAASRAASAGFEVIDLHGAHGYLLHSFLSPLSNHRSDAYGGTPERRMRYPLEVVDAVRDAIGPDRALFYRVSLVDGLDGGLTIENTIEFARQLYDHGVDLIDCSSGGVIADRRSDTRIRRGFAFHAPYSAAVREAAGGLVATVGLIVDPAQAEAVLRHGDADVIAIGREILSDPNWPHHARAMLEEADDFTTWHAQAGWWLDAPRQGGDQIVAHAGQAIRS